MSSMLDITRSRHVARILLARPDANNTLNGALIAELNAAFSHLGTDSELRTIVLGGHGKSFCAGADLGWMLAIGDSSWEENRADAQAMADMLWTLYRCPIPVICRVQGECHGVGMGLAAVCDVVLAADGASFCLSEARHGLMPATIAPFVIRALGEQASRRYFVTAEKFGATRAMSLGLVHAVTAADGLDAKVDEIVARLTGNGPAALRACKRLVQDYAGKPIDEALRTDSVRRFASARASVEGKEGMLSLLNQRAPAWKPASS